MMNDNQCHSDREKETPRTVFLKHTLKWIINNNNNSWQAASSVFLFHGKTQRLKLKKVERQRQHNDVRMLGIGDRTRRKSINRKLMIFFFANVVFFSQLCCVIRTRETMSNLCKEYGTGKNTFNHKNEFVEMMLFNCVYEVKEMDEKSISSSSASFSSPTGCKFYWFYFHLYYAVKTSLPYRGWA